MPTLTRRDVVAGMATLAACATGAPRPDPAPPAPEVSSAPPSELAARHSADFDALWEFTNASYCFFADKRTDWHRARDIWRARAIEAPTNDAFVHALEGLLDELYDPHCMLGTNTPQSWRPVPYDLWAEPRGDAAILTAVRTGSAAEVAGLRAGMEVVAIGGVPIREIARERLPGSLRAPDPAAEAWALLSAVTGRHADRRRFTVKPPGETAKEIEVGEAIADERPTVAIDRPAPEIARIRIASFADLETIDAFDAALEQVRDTKGLLLDVRANSGGDTAVARPIMGRFIGERSRYATMARREGDGMGEPWAEYVAPRGPWTYTGPVVMLVDRFSVSMAEGFAIGMHGMGRAAVVGTKMAALGAAIGRVQMHNAGIAAQISTEPVYHVDGTPRWQFRPSEEVDPVAAKGTDPILAAGLARLRASADNG